MYIQTKKQTDVRILLYILWIQNLVNVTLGCEISHKYTKYTEVAKYKNTIRIFVNNQHDAQFFFMYVYFYSLHGSGSHVPIIRRISCINMSLCIDDRLVHIKRSSIQSDIYQMSY
jgi:hypothetical protein